jgi:hypothetical protein
MTTEHKSELECEKPKKTFQIEGWIEIGEANMQLGFTTTSGIDWRQLEIGQSTTGTIRGEFGVYRATRTR